MLTAAVFSVILAAAAAQSFPPVDLPSSCAAVTCPIGTVCREEPNKNGDIEARCKRLVAPKPGDCPSPDPFGFGVCAKMCWHDSQCSGDKKCCRTSCGGWTCQQPKPSCDTMKCEPGQKCEMQDVVCVRAPCDPQPVCVNVGKPDKPGVCPVPEPFTVGICAFTCNSDSDCNGDKKCCKTSCGGTSCQSPQSLIPTTPAPTRPTCANVRCGFGKRCVMTQVYCVRAPCYRQPVCVDIDKPGECPKSWFVPYFSFHCSRRCSDDADCPRDRKCCKAGCGTRCQDPVTCATKDCEPEDTCVVKMKCNKRGCSLKPVCEPVKRCPFYPAWINPNCVREDRCSLDDPNACAEGTLCCSTDCGRQCVTPME